ncbi:MAG: DUF3014 domain-containing protein [Burkholderiaceae bacterium]|nr:DUF3014 domain-containing protein [Burkholderiaceae bacterium]
MTRKWVWTAVVAIAVIAAALLWWRQRESATPEPAPATMPAPIAQAPGTAQEGMAPASAPAALVPAHPIEAASDAASGAQAGPVSLDDALIGLLGRKAVLSMLQLDDFPRRFAATVDNLGRSSAPSRLWPVNPTPGHFTVETRADASFISADNGLRYTPFVLMVESVDAQRAVALYKQFYPQIQKAYEDIGFPNRYFNDRLVEVIDLLLATPEIETPLKVVLPTINGPERPERPWVLYEFDAPELQSLSAGQKILLRIGPVNERRLKARLAEIRSLVTKAPVSR